MPAQSDPAAVVRRFNDCITASDIDGLTALMTADHTFVDTDGQVVAGRDECRVSWLGFFEQFPDYRNVFTVVTADDQVVTMAGYSICAVPALAGPALWKATVRGGRVAGWRVYDDTSDNRALLGFGSDPSGQHPDRRDAR